MLNIRREMAAPLIIGTFVIAFTIGSTIWLCLSMQSNSLHLAVVAFLTTGGPLFARIFEGLIRRRHIIRALERDCLAAEDEILISRTVPLLMPLAGGLFAYSLVA